jgi:hypothetical protein
LHLYPPPLAGGFVIIDDFTDWTTCREAVDRYRAEQRIAADH